MRVRECQSPPSPVVEWLCSQLEQRGIPGQVYANVLLSLLHTFYCQDHLPSDESLKLGSHQDLPGLLELEEELLLGECFHPDADLPPVSKLYSKHHSSHKVGSSVKFPCMVLTFTLPLGTFMYFNWRLWSLFIKHYYIH